MRRAHRMPQSRSRRAATVVAVALVVVVVFGALSTVPLSARAQPTSARPHVAATSVFTGSVTWNGVDVSTASTVSSAFAIDFSAAAHLVYYWNSTTPATINDARLQMFYFGFAVATRDVYVSNPSTNQTGLVHLDWTPLSIGYVLEGVYLLTASILASNGTTMWSENFYVKGNALYGILAVIPIVLILLLIYEVYALVRSGRYAALGRKEPEPTESSPPSAGGAGGPGGAASTDETGGTTPSGAEGAPPADATPPPEGGTP